MSATGMVSDMKTGASATGFGLWLRGLRSVRGLTLRRVAAAVQMDAALLTNIENGRRLPSEPCAEALLRFFAVDPVEFRRRLAAARVVREYGADPDFIAAVAEQVREDAAVFGDRTVVKNPPNKK